MNVETFEIEEVKDEAGIMASDSEAQELIIKLGLEGQKTLLNTETVTRLPYRQMTVDEMFTYSILCPRKSKLKEFSSEIIPVRVLQVAAHALECGFFTEIWVWSAEMASVKDPVLVGITKDKNTQWGGELHYLLARWGKELEPLEILFEKAKQMRLRYLKGKAATIIHEVNAWAQGISEHLPLEKLQSEPHFYA